MIALIHLSLILALLLSLSPTTQAQSSKNIYLHHFCSNTTTFVKNSTFHTNLNNLFSSLSNNANNALGFYNTSFGQHPDVVYGLFLCRGDLNPYACQACATFATQDIVTRCPVEKVVVVWYHRCLLRYSNESFFSRMDTDPMVYMWNVQNVSDQSRFNDLLETRMKDLAAEASNTSAEAKKLAFKVENISASQKLYSLVQCTGDISNFDCSQCLENAISNLPRCCDGKQGGRILSPSCNVGFQIFPFNQSEPHVPSRKTTQTEVVVPTTLTITNRCTYTVWPGISSNADQNALSPSGFALGIGETKNFTAPKSWGGRIWGRTNCTQNSTGFGCLTGDCGSGMLECSVNGAAQPATFAEFTLDRVGGMDAYGVSFSDGYNIPLVVVPQTGSGQNCPNVGCVVDLNAVCPQELKVPNNITQREGTVACKSPCEAFKLSPDACKLTDYAKIFKKECPLASIYPYDSTFPCASATADYTIIFCPDPSTTKLPPPFGAPPPPAGSEINSPPKGKGNLSIVTVAAIVVPTTIFAIVLSIGCYFFRMRERKKDYVANAINEIKTPESLQMDLSTIETATKAFSVDNQLGQGGFGEVYKGILSNGKEIAVKKLSSSSRQGAEEFKNEVVLVAKLQHKNLVRLLGFCLEKEERILIFEFMPNKSLDYFLFDSEKQGHLDWPRRYKIIEGIAKGILYLHEDSRLKIIHRDLKVGNILLDNNMNPKVADFGMARIFEAEQTQESTNRIVGTYGYMSPEYAMQGLFSMKSDVYSFGVILLEMISGKRNNRFYHSEEGESLLPYAWKLWHKGHGMELMDPILEKSSVEVEVLKCIRMGLLCVQDDPKERPTMLSVVFMLSNDTIPLPRPKKPVFSVGQFVGRSVPLSSSRPKASSINLVTVSNVSPR